MIIISGPKYGEARIDFITLQGILAELKDMLEDAKCQKINEKIAEIQRNTDILKNEYSNANYENLINQSIELIPENENIKIVQEQLKLYNVLINTSFPSETKSTELLVTQMLYAERYNKIKNLLELMKISTATLRNNYDTMASLSDEERFKMVTWDAKKEVQVSLSSPKVNEMYEIMLEAICSESNFNEIIGAIDVIIANDNLNDDYKINQIQLRLDAIKVEGCMSENYREYQRLFVEYTALAESLGYTDVNIPMSLQELKEKVTEFENEIKQKTMSQYISNSLNKVMTELNYNIMGDEIVQKSSQALTKEYYDFSETSALSVATSNNGAVLFEVMGKQKELTDLNKKAVKNDMDRFCPDYKKIREKLKKYGITLEKEHLCEADIKYVRGVDISTIPNQSDRRGQKQMKRMDLDG